MTRRELMAGGAAAVAAARAQTVASKVERGKQLLDEVIAALGGAQFLAMRDRVERGRAYSFYRDRLTGLSRATIYTRYVMRPDPLPAEPGLYVRERQSFGKDKEEYAILFDEKNGYQVSERGARPLPKTTLDRYQDSTRRNIIYTLRQRMNEPGLLIESKGTEVFENQPVELVEIADSSNASVTVAVHRSTKLPVRQLFYRRDPLTRERREEVTLFSKWRNTDGVMWPWTITRTRDGEKIFEIFSDAVSINKGLDDKLFTLPSNLQILPEAR